jgi:serine/threonine protein kinase
VLIIIVGVCIFFIEHQKKDKAVFGKTDITLSQTRKVNTVTTTTGITLQQESISIPAYMEVPETSYKLRKKLREGGAGEVYLADALTSTTSVYGKKIVVKILKASDAQKEKAMKYFEQELSIMALLKQYDIIDEILRSRIVGLFLTSIQTFYFKDGYLAFC